MAYVRLSDYVNVFVEPRLVFSRQPSAPVAVPLFVLIVVSVLSYYAFASILEPAYLADFKFGVAAQSLGATLTEAQLQDAFATNMRLGGAFYVVTIPLTVVCIAGSIWAACALLSADLRFEQAVVIATWAYFPRLVQALSLPALSLVHDPDRIDGIGSLSAGIAFFMDRQSVSTLLYQMLLRVDVFTLWMTCLIVCGIRALGGPALSLRIAVIAGSLVYVVGYLPTLASALR